jgi:WhiB family transcriptional regulator, redox-sensing transcriptional regulator
MEWRDRAACRNVDPELFFPLTFSGPSQRQTEQALAVCTTCSVRSACLDWAIANDVVHGVWGGLSEDQRVAAHRASRKRSAVSV